MEQPPWAIPAVLQGRKIGMNSKFDPDKVIYTPPEVSLYGKKQVGWIKENQHRALNFFIPGIDEYFAPMLPGESCIVIGQTSNYKSGFLHAWEFAAARQFQAQKREEVIVHVSVEENVEEQAYLLLGIESGMDSGQIARGQVQDWTLLEKAAIKVGTVPIYRIGHSLARPEHMSQLYLSNMIRALIHLRDNMLGDRKIGAIFFDYLQAFPFDTETKTAGMEARRRLQVRNDFYRIHDAATFFQCPVIVASQAKQHLNFQGPIMIPSHYDSEESSAPAQRTSRSIQLWMPKMNYPPGHRLKHGGFSFDVKENHIFVKAGKQRGRLPAGKSWLCWIDFSKNTVTTIGKNNPPTNSNSPIAGPDKQNG